MKPDSTTIHLRITFQLRDAIQKQADVERRPWTQMAVLLLQDAVEQQATARKRRAHTSKEVTT